MNKMTTLLTCLLYILVVLTTYCWTWTSEIIPNRQIKYGMCYLIVICNYKNYNYSRYFINNYKIVFTEPGRYEIFNGTGTDYFKILDIDETSILIGSK